MEDIIIAMAVVYGYPAVLFKHDNGFAWKWKNGIKDIGNVTKERAVEMFKWNFGVPYLSVLYK